MQSLREKSVSQAAPEMDRMLSSPEGRERNVVPFWFSRMIRVAPSKAARPSASVLSLDSAPAPVAVRRPTQSKIRCMPSDGIPLACVSARCFCYAFRQTSQLMAGICCLDYSSQ